MTIARSVARAVASPVARAVGAGDGSSMWKLLLDSPNLVVRLNGDSNGDGTGDANDWAGNYNATWFGTAEYSDVRPQDYDAGKSFVLDGTTDYLTVPSAAGDLTDNFTVSCWIYADTLGNVRLVSKRGAAAPLAWDFYLYFVGRLELYTGSTYVGATEITSGSWYHIALVIDGANSRFMVNGVQSGSSFSPTITQNSVNVHIGRYAPSAVQFFDGRIYDFRIYNRALSNTEIATLARI